MKKLKGPWVKVLRIYSGHLALLVNRQRRNADAAVQHSQYASGFDSAQGLLSDLPESYS